MTSFIKKTLIVLFTLCIVSCFSCAKQEQVNTNTPPIVTVDAGEPSPPPPTTITVTVGNASIILPSTDWSHRDMGDSSVQVYENVLLKNVIILVGGAWSGTLDALSLDAIRSFRNVGATITGTSKVTINGVTFVLVEAVKDDVAAMTWLTVNKGIAYSFACRNPVSAVNGKEFCSSIANTFKLN